MKKSLFSLLSIPVSVSLVFACTPPASLCGFSDSESKEYKDCVEKENKANQEAEKQYAKVLEKKYNEDKNKIFIFSGDTRIDSSEDFVRVSERRGGADCYPVGAYYMKKEILYTFVAGILIFMIGLIYRKIKW